MISDIFGIKLSGGFTLNPLKKLGSNGFVGATAGAIGGSVLGAVGGAIHAEKGFGNKLKGALSNGLSAGYYGGKDGLSGKGNLISSIKNGSVVAMKNRKLGETLVANGLVSSGPFARQRFAVKDWWSDVTGETGSTGTTNELRDKINQLSISSRIATEEMTSAQQSRALKEANASDGLRSIIASGAFKDVMNLPMTQDGQIEFVKNANGKNIGVNWSDIVTFDDLLTQNENLAKLYSTPADYDNGKAEFESYVNDLKKIRDSRSTVIINDAQKEKLQRDRDKADGMKKK